MVGLIVFLFALLIFLKDDEDNLFIPFILLTFSIMFVMFSPVIATMTVSGTNIFSATKQYSETYHIVGLQDLLQGREGEASATVFAREWMACNDQSV